MKLQRLLQLHLNNVAGIGIARLHADALMPNHNIDEGYLDCLAKDTSHVINALAHQHDSMLLKRLHAKLCQIRAKGN